VADSGELKVEVVPVGPTDDALRAAAQAALEHLAVRRELDEGPHRLLSVTAVPDDPEDDRSAEPERVRATVYDYVNDRALVIDTSLDDPAHVEVTSTIGQPPPTSEEFALAVSALERDPELGPELREGRLTAYRPMPPLVGEELPDGATERTLAVGLRAPDVKAAHEIVGVRIADGTVRRFEGGAPAAALATDAACGLPNANQPTADRGTAGAARITVRRGGDVLWNLIAVRPAASSGTNGSGVELRSVAYRGKRVLKRAHVPILNVRYDGDACGPYRDWQWQEGMLEANGTDAAPGFRLCTSPAKTALESGNDQGNFLGVAIYVEGDEIVLVSELEAGWYRYISQWRLDADGTIRPRFAFGAVESSCVCNLHHHHTYWRFDFDVAGAPHNEVREFNDPPLAGGSAWRTLGHEVRRRRDPDRNRRWQVRNRETGESYTLVPGAEDGRADPWGVGDMWAVKRRAGALDDGQGFTTDPDKARAHIDRFVNGQSIRDADVVVWYAAHFAHDVQGEPPGEHHGHIVGPELVPGGWS
jgi:hypothetical protein